MHLNVVSGDILIQNDILWNQETHLLYHKLSRESGGAMKRQFSQWVIAEGSFEPTVFINPILRLPNPPRGMDAELWHRRCGHIGVEALGQLTEATLGVKINGPKTHQCEVCATGKARREISREIPDRIPCGPGRALNCDLHYGLCPSYDGYRYWVLFTYIETKMRFFYPLREKSEVGLAFRKLRAWLKAHFGIEVLLMWCDGEPALWTAEVINEMTFNGTTVYISAASTLTQNGGAEMSGKTTKDKSRVLRLVSGFPEELWSEINRHAVYQANRTPYNKTGKWVTPYQQWWSWVRDNVPAYSHISPRTRG